MAQNDTQIPALADVFQSLERVRPQLEKDAPQLAGQITLLAQKHQDPDLAANERFRTNVAYVLQDAERLVGPVLPQENGLREEMTQRAMSVPGLTSETLKGFMGQTADLMDQRLVDTVRSVSERVASMGADQQGNPEIDEVLQSLSERVATAARFSTHDPDAQTVTQDEQADVRPVEPASEFDGSPEPPPFDDIPDAPEPEDSEDPRLQEGDTSTRPSSEEKADPRMHASPGGGEPGADQPQAHRPERPANAGATENKKAAPEASSKADTGAKAQNRPGPAKEEAKPPEQEADEKVVYQVRGPGLFTRLAQAIRPEAVQQAVTPGSNWMAKAQTMNAAHGQQADANHLDQTEALGLKAQSALEAVQNTPASSVMREIAEAAKSEPNGMDGVLSEMRPGGRHEGLQSRFQTERSTNQAFAAQLKEAGEAVAAYGAHREKAADIGVQRGTEAQVEQRFNGLDSKIGELAKGVPGKEAGTSMVEELSEKARELVKKAVEAVASVFRPSPSASASASPGL
ncbi:hypothetical protein [Gluconobacter albidus]|uniref:Uncharacterized protein n=1 Tax=Gluconobacter albidus TaxID=318683 RepID=A0AAW3QZL0_9PROT|nr:hypothetical protein [Gluconobacter albidus]KXV40854.1 hypothetical protein AD941_03840 [Gluconobacter albidus]GBQ94094.1 hypothetical protein AA3250_2969 [Gluconobacter albidus NBRC 3250]GLQ68539.1 hypothetical protein GCM10007866_09880 [Gluconobacter albidus]